MKNRKSIILIVISILIIIICLLLFSYAFFSHEYITSNLNVNVIVSQGSFSFVVDGQTNVNLNVSTFNMLVDQNNTVASSSELANFNVTYTSALSDATCSYEIYWNWSDDSDEYQKSNTSQIELEYVVLNNGITYHSQVKNGYGGQYIMSKTISANTTDHFQFGLKFYNLNVNQDYHANKIYKGYYSVKNVICDDNAQMYRYDLVDYLYDEVAQDMGNIGFGGEGLLDDAGGMGDGARYIGSDPDNYIRFNNQNWRIIGIIPDDFHGMSGQKFVKIVGPPLNNQTFYYDRKAAGVGSSTQNYGSTLWRDSQLMYMLNGTHYLKSDNCYSAPYIYDDSSCTGNILYQYYGNNLSSYYDNGSYVYEPLETDMIPYDASFKVYLGSARLSGAYYIKAANVNIADINGGLESCSFNSILAQEKISLNADDNWTGAIMLPTVTDVAYSTSGSSTYGRNDCLGGNNLSDSWNNENCSNNSWLTGDLAYYLQTTFNSTGTNSLLTIVSDNNTITYGDLNTKYYVLPVVYLNNVNVVGGTGSIDDPYKIEKQ